MDARCRIELLGGLKVSQGERVISRFRTRQTGTLLAYLASHLGRHLSREVLIEALWPDVEARTGRNNLSIALNSLRSQLEPPGVPAGAVLLSDRFSVGLNPSAIVTDVAEFLSVLQAAQSANEDASRNAALRQAIDLYHGELLPGFYDDWVMQERHRLQAHYEQAQEVLNHHVPDVPSSAVLPAVAAPTLPTPQPGPHDTHLPLQFTRFFGREEELEVLSRWCAGKPEDKTHHLLTLTGPGGTGKTRLAIEAACRLAQTFSGGVWFVPLQDLADPRLIPGAVLDALRLPRLPQVEPLQQVVAFLNGRASTTLLVLDNMEQLLEGDRRKAEDGASVVRALLDRCPSLTCLVTSRQSLALEGERELPVLPLPTPGSNTRPSSDSIPSLPDLRPPIPEELMQFASVQLFVDRAQSNKPDFQVTAGNAAAIAQLCDRLEGIPLALVLAAGRAQVDTPKQMVSELEHRFNFLVSRRRDATERHRTLWAAIEWSYRLLSPELRRFFARLSVFRGGWTVEAAAAVCEEPMALDYLAQLQECSLILAVERGGEMRFRMLEMMQEFGREQMAQSGEETAIRRRHRDHFLRLAEQAEPILERLERGNWMERLEIEHDNFRAALDWCEANAQEAEAGLRLAGALYEFWDQQGYLREARARLEAALANGVEAPAFERGKVLAHLGWCCLSLFDYVAARRHFEDDLALRQESGDRRGEAKALWHLGAVLRDQREFAAARPYFEECLALSQEFGVEETIVNSLQCLGMLTHFQGDFASAYPLYEEALAKRREAGSWIAAWSLNLLGLLCFDTGDYASAQTHYAESLAIFTGRGYKKGIAHCLEAFAMLAAAQGRFQRGGRLFGASDALRAPQSIPVNALARTHYEENLTAVRTALGKEAFAVAWEEGQRLTLEQAIAYALEATGA